MKESLVLAIFTVGLAASSAASAAGAVPPDYVPPSASSAGVPPDYNPNTATTVTAPRGFTPPTPVSQVPPDTQNSQTATVTDGRVTTTTTYPPTPIIKTESGVLNSLKPRAPQLPLSEQIDLIRRNQADIAERRAADAAPRLRVRQLPIITTGVRTVFFVLSVLDAVRQKHRSSGIPDSGASFLLQAQIFTSS